MYFVISPEIFSILVCMKCDDTYVVRDFFCQNKNAKLQEVHVVIAE